MYDRSKFLWDLGYLLSSLAQGYIGEVKYETGKIAQDIQADPFADSELQDLCVRGLLLAEKTLKARGDDPVGRAATLVWLVYNVVYPGKPKDLEALRGWIAREAAAEREPG